LRKYDEELYNLPSSQIKSRRLKWERHVDNAYKIWPANVRVRENLENLDIPTVRMLTLQWIL
jgi:hypothetical protein